MSATTDIARLVGRLALALIFILSGFNKIMNFGAFSDGLAEGGLPLPQVLTVLAIALELGSALALAVGFHGRLAALGLVVFTILATAIGHRFWEISDPAVQPMQMIMFLKNIAIIGGLLQVWAGGVGRFAIGPLTIGRFTIGRPGIGDGSAG